MSQPVPLPPANFSTYKPPEGATLIEGVGWVTIHPAPPSSLAEWTRRLFESSMTLPSSALETEGKTDEASV